MSSDLLPYVCTCLPLLTHMLIMLKYFCRCGFPPVASLRVCIRRLPLRVKQSMPASLHFKRRAQPKEGKQHPGGSRAGLGLYSAHVVPELSSSIEGATIAFFFTRGLHSPKNLYSAHVVPDLSSRMGGTTIAFFFSGGGCFLLGLSSFGSPF